MKSEKEFKLKWKFNNLSLKNLRYWLNSPISFQRMFKILIDYKWLWVGKLSIRINFYGLLKTSYSKPNENFPFIENIFFKFILAYTLESHKSLNYDLSYQLRQLIVEHKTKVKKENDKQSRRLCNAVISQ